MPFPLKIRKSEPRLEFSSQLCLSNSWLQLSLIYPTDVKIFFRTIHLLHVERLEHGGFDLSRSVATKESLTFQHWFWGPIHCHDTLLKVKVKVLRICMKAAASFREDAYPKRMVSAAKRQLQKTKSIDLRPLYHFISHGFGQHIRQHIHDNEKEKWWEWVTLSNDGKNASVGCWLIRIEYDTVVTHCITLWTQDWSNPMRINTLCKKSHSMQSYALNINMSNWKPCYQAPLANDPVASVEYVDPDTYQYPKILKTKCQ